jgi:Lipase (class 3)
MKDAKIALNLQPNPVRGVEKGHANEKIGIHCGFYDYLLRPRKEGGNKLDEIVGHVRTLFVEMPERRRDYKLYVTGHSLGGALATLFSLYVAASLEETANVIPKPVCCFSVASPRVGDLSFQAAFRRLEELGLVRHLRIANDRDPVTMMPSASGKKMLLALSPISYLAVKLSDKQFAEKEHFRHTGVKLLLTKDSCEFSYMGHPMNTDDREETVDDETHDTSSASSMKSLSKSGKPKPSFRLNSIPDVAFHLGNAYTENLASVKSELLNLALNDLYSTSVVSIVAEHGN